MQMQRRGRRIVLLSLLVILLLMFVISVDAQDETITLTISGSGSTQRVLSAVQEAFEADVAGYHLDILSGSGTGGGVKGVTQGILDIAAMARPPKDAELEVAPTFQYVEFGSGSVTILAHPDTDISDLTADQAVGIFSGDITNWSAVGGPDAEIVVYVRDESDSSTAVLRETLFGDLEFPETVEILTSQGDMEAAVEGTPFSVGFGAWPATLASETDIIGVTIDGIAANDPENPTLKPLGLGYLGEREADVQPFIDWLLSEDGQYALQEFDVVTAMMLETTAETDAGIGSS